MTSMRRSSRRFPSPRKRNDPPDRPAARTEPNVNESPLRQIPSLDALLREPGGEALLREYGRQAVVGAGRALLDGVRAEMASTGAAAGRPALSPGALLDRLKDVLCRKFRPSLGPAVNATGIIMHSGLGRAVLSGRRRATPCSPSPTAIRPSPSTSRPDGARPRDRHVEGVLRGTDRGRGRDGRQQQRRRHRPRPQHARAEARRSSSRAASSSRSAARSACPTS